MTKTTYTMFVENDAGADEIVARIKELNRFDEAVLVPGLPLTVPVAGTVPAP